MRDITMTDLYQLCQTLNDHLASAGSTDEYHAVYQLGWIDLLKYPGGSQDNAKLLNTYSGGNHVQKCYDDVRLIHRVLE